MPEPRGLPPPWTVEETEPCFIVCDANGQALAFVYCEDEPGRRTTAKFLTRDEARLIAANIAKLPGSVTAGALRRKIDPALIEILTCSQDLDLIRLDQVGDDCALGFNIGSGSTCTLAHGVVHEIARLCSSNHPVHFRNT
jgi:hypothetical protein